jgi:hypothetical protein
MSEHQHPEEEYPDEYPDGYYLYSDSQVEKLAKLFEEYEKDNS